MQLYILDKDPVESAQRIPDKYKFKMLIELGQLICSAGFSDVYKYRPQGKELQQWIKDNKRWTHKYLCCLLDWSFYHTNMKAETINNLVDIRNDLEVAIGVAIGHDWLKNSESKVLSTPEHAYFRYVKTYQCAIPSKTLLPIEVCIEAYKEYLKWKTK